jgi:hypothetical protein
MTNKLRYFGVFLVLGLLALSSLASRFSVPFGQSTTPGPKIKPTPIPLEAQAGHSDGILILGILIFIFIAVPILLRYKDWRSS